MLMIKEDGERQMCFEVMKATMAKSAKLNWRFYRADWILCGDETAGGGRDAMLSGSGQTWEALSHADRMGDS